MASLAFNLAKRWTWTPQKAGRYDRRHEGRSERPEGTTPIDHFQTGKRSAFMEPDGIGLRLTSQLCQVDKR